MNTEIDKKIRKGLPPKRNERSYQTQHDIVIPAGTILRSIGDNEYAAAAAHGTFSLHVESGAVVPVLYRPVTAA